MCLLIDEYNLTCEVFLLKKKTKNIDLTLSKGWSREIKGLACLLSDTAGMQLAKSRTWEMPQDKYLVSSMNKLKTKGESLRVLSISLPHIPL